MKKGVAVAAAVTAAAMVVGTALLLRHWKRRSERQWRLAQRILRKFANDSATPVAKLWRVADEIASEAEGNSSSLCKIVSDIAPLPTGEEKGTFYGVNLRGTDFVIVRARLEGKNEPLSELHKEKVQIPYGIMANGGSSKELFDFIALELAKFISLHSETDSDRSSKERILGFTISHSTDQNRTASIDVKLNNVSTDDKVGKELANEINHALEKRGVDMRVFTVVKDTIGHLAGGRYYSSESVAAVSLGTGTDVAYVESSQQTSTIIHNYSAETTSVIE
ncbi:hypothetical protein OROMI_000763 [Orobanche minor]